VLGDTAGRRGPDGNGWEVSSTGESWLAVESYDDCVARYNLRSHKGKATIAFADSHYHSPFTTIALGQMEALPWILIRYKHAGAPL
jgi:prepilin-type processing-associated H-X9-DG protein